MMKRIMFLTLLAAAAGLAQTVNCLVAVVNGEIITLLDVEVAAEFGLGRQAGVEAGRDPGSRPSTRSSTGRSSWI